MGKIKEFKLNENILEDTLKQEITDEERQKLIKKEFSKKVKLNRLMKIFNDGFREIEKNNTGSENEDITVTDITVSANNYSYLRLLSEINIFEGSSKEEILKGNYGKLWWATVHVKKNCNGIIFECRK